MLLRTKDRATLAFLEDAYAKRLGLSERRSIVELARLEDDPRFAGELARLVALGEGLGFDRRDSIAILDRIVSREGPETLGPEIAALFGQLLLREGEIERLTGILESLNVNRLYRWSLKVDSINPTLTDSSESSWLATFNELFMSDGLEPIYLGHPGAAPFDRLECEVSDRPAGRALVSVIMPVYRPTGSLITAVRSVLAQSWPSIEVIIVDDGSPDEYRDQFLRVQAMDPRVRVIRGAGQFGSYIARNQGMQYAEGDFVTFQDGDDWAHPRRIERQITPLLADHGLLATRSRIVRAYGDLTTTYVGYPPVRMNASSLMFRRGAVTALAGYFDSARKSADDEFFERLRAARSGSVLDLRRAAPLSIGQLTPGSLSRDETRPGWLHWGRVAYRNAFRSWHRQIVAGVSTAYHDGSIETRPFALPDRSWAPIRSRLKVAAHYDVVLVNDWRSGREPGCLGSIHAAVALARAGMKVAIAHDEVAFPPASRREPVSGAAQAEVNERTFDFVHRTQTVNAALALVCTPLLERALGPLPPSWEVESTVVLPPTSQLDRTANDPVEPGVEALRLGTVIVPEVTEARVPRCDRDRPVAGRIAPNSSLYWPEDRRELLRAYPRNGSVDVRILGAVGPALEVIDMSAPPSAWTHFRPGQVTPREFLAQLDFYLHFPGEAKALQPHRGILEAMASGCVPVLPPTMDRIYGGAAIYSEPRDLRKRLAELWSRPAVYRKQQRRGREWVRENSTTGEFVAAVAGMIR